MEAITISVPIVESPLYKDVSTGVILKDSGESIATFSPIFNFPKYAKKFSQFDLGDMIREVVPNWTDGEDPINLWSEEDQGKIKAVKENFHNSYTRIYVSADFGGLPVDALTAKKFDTSFEVHNDKIQDTLEFCQGVLVDKN